MVRSPVLEKTQVLGRTESLKLDTMGKSSVACEYDSGQLPLRAGDSLRLALDLEWERSLPTTTTIRFEGPAREHFKR